MDTNTWAVREVLYTKKFEAGRKHIPSLFNGISLPSNIEKIALLGFGSNANVKNLADGRVMTPSDLLAGITAEIGKMRIASATIPEQYLLLRTIQLAYQHRHAAEWR